MIIHDPENTFKCDHIYAYISEDENGLQGIIGFNGLPLIFANKSLADRMEPIVTNLVKKTSKKAKLMKYSNPEVIKEF